MNFVKIINNILVKLRHTYAGLYHYLMFIYENGSLLTKPNVLELQTLSIMYKKSSILSAISLVIWSQLVGVQRLKT